MKNTSKDYAMYLRKSRKDIELEALGQGETLARHRSALTELAERQGLHIARIYEEMVSGESIAARPKMQELLDEVCAGVYALQFHQICPPISDLIIIERSISFRYTFQFIVKIEHNLS